MLPLSFSRHRGDHLSARTPLSLLGCLSILTCTLALGAAAPSGPGADQSQILTVEGNVQISSVGQVEWQPAKTNHILRLGDRLKTGKNSRATVRLSDQSVFRVNELTTLELQTAQKKNNKPLLDLKSGSVYFFSREKPEEVQFRTPVVVGAIRGTEFHVQVAEDGETRLALLDGEVILSNEVGQLVLQRGEQALAKPGQAPIKTAVIDAINMIQWCLYYPAILDLDELGLSALETRMYRVSLEAYRSGDVLQALASFPQDQEPASDGARIYRAALMLACGQIEQAEAQLRACGASSPLVGALRELIAAVQNRSWTRQVPPTLATEWLAESYYLQSRAKLEEALKAARAAAARSPSFGFAWVRLAELEFSFGRASEARKALEKGLQLSPRNAQGLALQGFVLSAQDRPAEAVRWFDEAIAVDGALGNAWLGRGLCRLRRATSFPLVIPAAAEEGRRDLQIAAALEPNRALLRSYLAKAFSNEGQDALAEKDLRLAKQLDPNDPTAWLYSALLNQQRNRINEAISDLERSQELNDHRRLFRSRLMLDQDRAVRGANLALAYQDAGMFDVSVREAAQAVNCDYANSSAHRFLAESYDALRDPKKINLRYETPRVSELLMANLLAPVGAGNLSQNISQQDYTRLFDGNRLGVNSSTEYRSTGDWIQYGSQYGILGNSSYALDSYYRSENGHRPNNDLEQLNLSLQLKQQLTPRDSVYVQAVYYDAESGDVAQYYDQTKASPSLRITEKQQPNLFLGYHHEWSPGAHTLFLAGRIDDTLTLQDGDPKLLFLRYMTGEVTRVIVPPLFSLNYKSSLAAYSTELQQLWQTPAQTLILGARYQVGWNNTQSALDRQLTGPVTRQDLETDLHRLALYAYYQWQVFAPLRLTAGLSYDRLHYPLNIDTSPIIDEEADKDLVSPKVGLVFNPWQNVTLRGLYTRSLGGVFYDQSLRLEPTQIAGFNQAFRSIIPESAVGIVPGTRFETGGLGLDLKLAPRTYLGIDGEILSSDAERTVGVLTNATFFAVPDSPSSTRQTLDFEERSLAVTLNQLIGREWSLGARYRISRAELTGRFLDVPLTAAGADQINQNETAVLHQVNLFVIYNHRCGFFSQFHSVWSQQSNQGYAPDRPGDDFWQFNFFVGYRFPKRMAEVRLGVLNLSDRDYRLNPINLYFELPRERTLVASMKFSF